MNRKRSGIIKIFAALLAAGICMSTIPAMANASEVAKEYGFSGKIVASGPIFNGESSVTIADGCYTVSTADGWSHFRGQTADGSIDVQHYLERDHAYRLVVRANGETQTYRSDETGLIVGSDGVRGQEFQVDGYQIDFSGLTFTEIKDKLSADLYVASGEHSLNADYIQVWVYHSMIDIRFFQDGQEVGDVAGNYYGVNESGAFIFSHDYEGYFKCYLTADGKLRGSQTYADDREAITFDLQLVETGSIKPGNYVAYSDFGGQFDEVRMEYEDLRITMKLLKAGTVVSQYEMYLIDLKTDGTLVFDAYDAETILCSLEISPAGVVTGRLDDHNSMELNMQLTAAE